MASWYGCDYCNADNPGVCAECCMSVCKNCTRRHALDKHADRVRK